MQGWRFDLWFYNQFYKLYNTVYYAKDDSANEITVRVRGQEWKIMFNTQKIIHSGRTFSISDNKHKALRKVAKNFYKWFKKNKMCKMHKLFVDVCGLSLRHNDPDTLACRETVLPRICAWCFSTPIDPTQKVHCMNCGKLHFASETTVTYEVDNCTDCDFGCGNHDWKHVCPECH